MEVYTTLHSQIKQQNFSAHMLKGTATQTTEKNATQHHLRNGVAARKHLVPFYQSTTVICVIFVHEIFVGEMFVLL